jgi:iron complex outermembrane receptor protein
MTVRIISPRLAIAVGALSLSCPGVALAQEAGAAGGPQATQDESEASTADASLNNDIVVTARKREERLQDVPLTISVVTAEKIGATGTTNVQQLSNMTPGFHFEAAGSRQESSVRFRGLDINTSNPTRQNASFFLDGVYFPGTIQSINFADLARVEVIKGPQSALFGRQTFGGAVNFITKDPTNDLAGSVTGTLQEDGYEELTGELSIPVIRDKLFLRLSGRYYDFDGAFRNSVDGRRLGAQNSQNYGATVIARPFEWLELKLRYLGADDDDGAPATAQIGINDLNCQPVPGRARFFCGEIPPVRRFALNTTVGPNPLGLTKFGFTRELDLFSGAISAEIGDFTLSASAAAFRDNNINLGDNDLTGLPTVAAVSYQDFNDESYEVRLVSPGDRRFRFVVGAYYYDGFFGSIGQSSGSFAAPGGNGSRFQATAASTDALSRNKAAFGSVAFDILENLTVTGELRYQEDKVTNIAGAGAARRTLSGKTTRALPRVIVDWKPSPGILLYGIFSQGNKPKQFNANIAGLTQAQQDFVRTTYGVETALDEERRDNDEVGLKADLFNRLLTTNIALYRMEWANQITRVQVFPSAAAAAAGTGQIDAVAPAGSSRINGLELEATLRPTNGLMLEGTFGYTDAKYTKFNSVNNQQVFGDPDTSGKRAPRYPKFAGSIAAAYSTDIASGWRGTARVDTSYKGRRFTDEVNLAYAGAYWNTNLRLTAESANLRFSVYVRNLFDVDAVQSASRFRDISVPGNAFSFPYLLLDPRQFGATASFRF